MSGLVHILAREFYAHLEEAKFTMIGTSEPKQFCQASKLNCEMFSDFIHSNIKQTDELCFSLQLSVMSKLYSDLTYKSIY